MDKNSTNTFTLYLQLINHINLPPLKPWLSLHSKDNNKW